MYQWSRHQVALRGVPLFSSLSVVMTFSVSHTWMVYQCVSEGNPGNKNNQLVSQSFGRSVGRSVSQSVSRSVSKSVRSNGGLKLSEGYFCTSLTDISECLGFFGNCFDGIKLVMALQYKAPSFVIRPTNQSPHPFVCSRCRLELFLSASLPLSGIRIEEVYFPGFYHLNSGQELIQQSSLVDDSKESCQGRQSCSR